MTEKLPYKTLFEISQDLMVIANINGYFKKNNPQWCILLGYTEQEILSKPFIEFVHSKNRLKPDQVAFIQKDNGITVSKFNNRYLTKDGEIRYLEWNTTSVDATGLIFAIARDQPEAILQRKTRTVSIKELSAKKKQLQDFAYIASHNLKPPVTYIFILTKFLKDSGFKRTFHNPPEVRSSGVYITKSQIEALNGKILVQSKPNKATTSTVNLAS